jgi:hypothetical protein
MYVEKSNEFMKRYPSLSKYFDQDSSRGRDNMLVMFLERVSAMPAIMKMFNRVFNISCCRWLCSMVGALLDLCAEQRG